jgi:hypothetical protein
LSPHTANPQVPEKAAEKAPTVTMEQGATSTALDTTAPLPAMASLPTTSLPIVTVAGGSGAFALCTLATSSVGYLLMLGFYVFIFLRNVTC